MNIVKRKEFVTVKKLSVTEKIMCRRTLAVLLAAVMTVSLAVPSGMNEVSAKENKKITYVSQNAASDGKAEEYEYVFEKLSHPDQGTQTPDGIVDYVGNGVVAVPGEYENVEGDRGQSYSWSALAYGDYLYVGTCYAAMGNTLSLMQGILGDQFDSEVMEAALNAMFNGTFYFGHEDGVDSKGILVKMDTKTGELELLMADSQNGISPLFRNGIVYKDKLYFCGSVSTREGGSSLPSVYEIDPKTDEYKAVYVGLNNKLDSYAAYKAGISTGIRGMCIYNDELIISNVTMDHTTGESGALILASSDPSEGFRVIGDSDTLFNYPAYRYQDSIYGGSIWDMIEYNGSLYVSMCTGTPENAPDDNTMRSFALVRGDEKEDGTFVWTSIAGDQENDGARYTFGIDPERTRSGAANLIVYNDYLYIGEYNDEEIALERILFNKSGEDADGSMGGIDCSFVNANLEQSVNLYRMDKDETMELVVGDATEMFPEGSLSGIGSGWDRNENQYVWRMQEYDGKLYLGTFDTSSLLEPIGQFSNGDIIGMTPEEWDSQFKYIEELLRLIFKTDDSWKPRKASHTSEKMQEDVNRFSEELELGSLYLSDTAAVMSLSNEDSVTERIAYYQAFADYYSGLLNAFEELQTEYDLAQDLTDLLKQLLTQENLEKVYSVIDCLTYMKTAVRGFDLYVSDDGINFETVTVDGFDDPYNHGLRVFAETDQGLCIGTANPFNGTQVWIQRKTEETPGGDAEEVSEVTRISGATRYETSYAIADTLKENQSVDQFETVIIANGKNFPDALAGSYLAAVKNAPILMASEKNQDTLQSYVKENLKNGGTIYVLGGTGAVTQEVIGNLTAQYQVIRLEGANRYETNLEILKEAGVSGEEILVCTGKGFADSLSASATGKPILLVNNKEFTKGQKAFLEAHAGNTFYIIGGEGAVSGALEAELSNYGTTERIYGTSRYETSVKVAEAFFETPENAVLAYAKNFPDGLCGGPLAAAMNAPMILTATGKEDAAAAYVNQQGITSGYVLGGAALISDEAVKTVFAMPANAEIQEK